MIKYKIIKKKDYDNMIKAMKGMQDLNRSLTIQVNCLENLLYGDNLHIDFPNSTKGGGPEDISGILEN